MGRPVRRDVNGTEVFGTATGAAAGIIVSARLPGQSTAKDGYIVAQRGARSYLVNNADGVGQCVLVQSITSEGQAVMTGITNPSTDAGVAIRKLQKRTAIDFSGNRYTWVLVNDSSADYIQLTLIS
jgi:hypothetical protein